MKKPQLQDSYDPLCEADIVAFESAVGERLPEDYRSFLLRHNGGDFPWVVSTPFDHRDSRYAIVSYLYGLQTANNKKILGVWKLIRDYLPTGFLPIGGDDMGDQICIAMSGPDIGSVWCWDHEEELCKSWPPENCTRLAENYTEFYEGLRYDPVFCEEDWKETLPAFMAAERGDVKGLTTLLNKGLDIEARNEFGETLLICAASARQSQIVRLLLEHGAEVEARDSKGQTALFVAAHHHSLDSAKLLLSAGADIDASNYDGDTPLLIGMKTGHRVPLYLIQQGANVNIRNNYGDSPLGSCGLFKEHLRIPLLEAGATE